jgi:hypothetical protein
MAIKSEWLSTAMCASLERRFPSTERFAYLGHYAYALRVVADAGERLGRAQSADLNRERAYWLRAKATR